MLERKGYAMAKVRPVDLATVPQLRPQDLRLLWVNDWYDGPVEGVVEHKNRRCLMVLQHHGDLARGDAYRWVVWNLSPEQLAEEERWHALFAKHVGDHWCTHDDTHPPSSEEELDPERFYGPLRSRTPLDLSANEAVGWIDELPQR